MDNKNNSEDNNKQLFYGVCLPSDVIKSNDIKLVFDNMRDTSEAVKKWKGSRFKAFDNINDAILFSQSIIVNKDIDSCDNNQSNKNIEKILSPFSSLHPRQLSDLRKAIESGDFFTVETLIQTNPRYLVGSGDNPSILMEGPRYNACHICAKANRPEILKFILTTISDKRFWKLLFPFDSIEITESRIDFSLDLYLNTPCSERALCDTPLHLSCKWGSVESVSILLSYPNCDKHKTNKFGKTPLDVICERKGDQNIKKEIQKLFEAQLYIPLTRDDFSAKIGKPIKWMENKDFNEKLVALAGPMSPEKADILYKTLKSPHKCSPNDRRIRLTDPQKGLERICRSICKDMAINWEEFWPFLNTRIDLTSDEGLNHLERHFQNIYYNLDKNSSIDRFSNENIENQIFDCSNLLNQLSELNLNSSNISDKSDYLTPFEDTNQKWMASEMDLSNDSSNDSFVSAFASPVFLYKFYINGSNISQEDIDAALALQHIIESDRCLKYEFIQDWFKRVSKESPKQFITYITPLSSTPTKL